MLFYVYIYIYIYTCVCVSSLFYYSSRLWAFLIVPLHCTSESTRWWCPAPAGEFLKRIVANIVVS